MCFAIANVFLDMKRIWREDYPTDKPF